MRLPSFKRLNKSDFQKEFRDLVDRLSVSLNIGIETLYTLADHRISLGDNIACVVRVFEIQVNAAGIPVAGTTNIAFGTTITNAVGTQVLRAENTTNPAVFPTGTPFVSFGQNGNSIDIKHIAGLPAGNTFSLTLVIWG